MNWHTNYKVLLVINDVFGDLEEAACSSQIPQDKLDFDELVVDIPEWCTELMTYVLIIVPLVTMINNLND